MSPAAFATVRPGALTALLADLARSPAGAGWEAPPLPGDRIGRFEIVREIGRGGFGVVYEARDAELGRSVALKTLRLGEDAATAAESVAEAEAAARLAHPNIVHLYDVGRDERGAYLIMELLRGRPLAEWVGLGAARAPVRDVLRVAIEIARGLAHAHANGIVHRDLKPANVLVCEDGQVKVLDFGLAHVFGREAVQGGTPAYMAPEQARGEIGDERSDVYALGVILAHLLDVPERGRIAPPLAKLVARMREQDPAARPASAKVVLEELVAIQRSLEPKRLLWATATVAVIAIVASVGLALRARPLPPGRLLVALADVENGTGDGAFDDLSSLLGTVLEESRRVSLLARGRIVGALRDAGRSPPPRLDERVVRDVARGVAANVLLVPAARRFGEGFELEVRGVDLQRNEPLFTVREHASARPAVLEAVDRLSDRVREELRETGAPKPSSRVKLAQLAPSDPEAWRHYAEGLRLDSEGRWREAGAAYERALKADPGFPLAHVKLAGRSKWFDDEKAQRHFDAAMRHADRLPPKERVLLEAQRAFLEARIEDALAAWDRAIAGWPQDQEAYKRAGFTLLSFLSDAQAARPYLEKALDLSALSTGAAIDALSELGRMDEALRRARRWAEDSPGPMSLAVLSEVYRRRGEPMAALDAARRSVAALARSRADTEWLNGASFWSFVDADAISELEQLVRQRGEQSVGVLAVQGRLRAALRLLEAKAEKHGVDDGGEDATAGLAVHHALRGALAWGAGDADAVWREVEEQLWLGSGATFCSTSLLASMGDARRAARLASLWIGVVSPRTFCARLYRHLRDWKLGDRAGAELGLRTMYGPEPAYHRGMILAELGRHREAVEAYRAVRRAPEWNFGGANLSAYPRTLYLEAASLERLGETDEARRLLDRLLRLWARADRDLPYLREARELRARLAVNGP